MFKMQEKFDELLVDVDIKVSSKVSAFNGMEGSNYVYHVSIPARNDMVIKWNKLQVRNLEQMRREY
jgi:hypothetical protein